MFSLFKENRSTEQTSQYKTEHKTNRELYFVFVFEKEKSKTNIKQKTII